MGGWIKLYTSITNHWIYKDSDRFKWWMDLLFMATWTETKYLARGHLIDLKKGEIVASASYLAERWLVNRKTVLKFLQLLQSDGMISTKIVYGSISIITICNYEHYQCDVDTSVDCPKDTTKDCSADTNKEYKEYKTIKETSPKGESKKSISLHPSKEEILKKVQEEQEKFKEELEPYLEIYGRDMLNDFYLYWTEPNKKKTKMKFQLEETWDTKRRLSRWEKNAFNKSNSNSNGNGKYQRPTKEERFAEVAELVDRKLAAIKSNQEVWEP